MFNVGRRGFVPLRRAVSSSISTIYKLSIISSKPNIPYRVTPSSRSFHYSVVRAYNSLATTASESRDRASNAPDTGDYITRFQDLADRGLVHRNVIDEIVQGMKYENMTEVQSKTINETLKGTDVIAQARTGTGKTLGFLIPVVQNILNKSPELAERKAFRRSERASPSDIRAIVISPTRELAEQLAVEAAKLVRATNLRVQVAVGGNSKRAMLLKMQKEGCHLLIATPGRLYDLLNDPHSRVSAPNLGFLVLDEADRLLGQGFADEIDQIMRVLPDRRDEDRQTLLFSATIPQEVMNLVKSTLKPDYSFIKTVHRGEVDTHTRVPQKLVQVNGLENIMPVIVELIQRELARNRSSEPGLPFKAIIYFNSTMLVNLATEILRNLKTTGAEVFGQRPFHPAAIFKIHAKLIQESRTRAADSFRKARSGILLSTDVTARGMDFPGVTHVIQVGIANERDTYVHRLGRTARGDKTGEGWVIATRDEAAALPRILTKLPLTLDDSLETAKVDMTRDAQLPADVAAILQQVADATQTVPSDVKEEAYISSIAHHSQSLLRRLIPSSKFVQTLNDWTRYGWGWEKPPSVPGMMGRQYGLATRSGGYGGRRDEEGFGGNRSVTGFGGGRGGGGRGGYGGGNGGSRGGSSGYGDRSEGRSIYSSRGGESGASGGYGDRRGGSSSYGGRGGESGGGGGYGDRRGGSSSYGDRGGESGGGGGGYGDRRGRGGSSFGGRGGRGGGRSASGFGAPRQNRWEGRGRIATRK